MGEGHFHHRQLADVYEFSRSIIIDDEHSSICLIDLLKCDREMREGNGRLTMCGVHNCVHAAAAGREGEKMSERLIGSMM